MQYLVFVGWMVLQFFNCRPLRGMWEPVPEMTCWPNQYSVVYGYVANGESRGYTSTSVTTNKEQVL